MVGHMLAVVVVEAVDVDDRVLSSTKMTTPEESPGCLHIVGPKVGNKEGRARRSLTRLAPDLADLKRTAKFHMCRGRYGACAMQCYNKR